MDIRKTRTCERCRATVPLEKVRFHPKDRGGMMVVCEGCSEELRKPKLPASKVSKLPAPEYATYTCTQCRYTFRADKSKIGITYNLHCPYCGKTDKLHKS